MDAEKPEASAIEESGHVSSQKARAVPGREQSDGERAPDAVGKMYRHRADRVVNVQLFIDKFDCENDEEARHNPDDCRAERIDGGTAGSDAHESGEGGV